MSYVNQLQGEKNILKVAQVNTLVKNILDNNRSLTQIYVQGELSNYKIYASGHHYFSLKDSSGSLRCVMFKSAADKIDFKPENGMEVIVFGKVSVFVRDGAYQLYAEKMVPSGAGALNVEFEKLKKRLNDEGLFDANHKKTLPKYPKVIGVVTSGSGAALHDILRVTRGRWPMAEIRVLPVRVQGENAGLGIARAIDYADKWNIADVLIVGRGGGSMEDLWCFNDERVAHAIYNASVPIISAVGHEPDITISDYVADARAATPSNGAEIAAPDQIAVHTIIKRCHDRIQAVTRSKLREAQNRLERVKKNKIFSDPLTFINNQGAELDFLRSKLDTTVEKKMSNRKMMLLALRSRFNASNPSLLIDRLKNYVTQDVRNRIERNELQYIAQKRSQVQALDRLLLKNDPKTRIKNSAYNLDAVSRRLHNAIIALLRQQQRKVDVLIVQKPNFSQKQSNLENLRTTLNYSLSRKIQIFSARLNGKTVELKAMNPLNVINRGYACVYNAKDNSVTSSVESVEKGTTILVKLKDGLLDCTVEAVRKM